MISAAHTGSQDVPNLKSRPTFLEHCRLGGDRAPGSSCPQSAVELGPASRVTRHMVTLSTRVAAQSSDSKARSLGAFVSAQMVPGWCQDAAGAQLSERSEPAGDHLPWMRQQSTLNGGVCVHAHRVCTRVLPHVRVRVPGGGHTLSRAKRALQRVQRGPQTLLTSGPRGPWEESRQGGPAQLPTWGLGHLGPGSAAWGAGPTEPSFHYKATGLVLFISKTQTERLYSCCCHFLLQKIPNTYKVGRTQASPVKTALTLLPSKPPPARCASYCSSADPGHHAIAS